MIAISVLLSSPILAEEEPNDYGKIWSNWTAFNRYIYLWGFKDGMSEGWNDLERFFHKTLEKDWSPYLERHVAFYIKSVSKNFPDLIEVRDVMTELYADSSNRYLEPRIMILVSVARVRGTSPELVDKLLATAREKSSQLRRMRGKETTSREDVMTYFEGPLFPSMVYEGIYGE
jgi:hypothetical protein